MSPCLVGVPSVPLAAAYAAPAWPLGALDAFPSLADNTPRPAAGVFPPAAADLPHGTPVLDDIFLASLLFWTILLLFLTIFLPLLNGLCHEGD